MRTDWEKMKQRLLEEGFSVVVKQNPATLAEENCYKKGNFYLFTNMVCGIEAEWNKEVYFKQLRILRSEEEVNFFFEQAKNT